MDCTVYNLTLYPITQYHTVTLMSDTLIQLYKVYTDLRTVEYSQNEIE